ncbi:EamA family transporter RarD [Halalkalibacterium ligniniphilum]|uniref:EamA family transporter RarD n=1 Tax=Halalkalibacterium ligniniphilum TaxID=1134413 RepID=UPI00034959FA|nr:EamA family transporter RarD [Halalkalibacterium ligniniphilum]
MNEQQKEQQLGVFAAIGAYLLWGVLPLYWKFLDNVQSKEVLAHRIVWSLLFMVVVLLLMGKLRYVMQEIIRTFTNKKSAVAITCAAVLITINWFVFIFAVNTDRVIEASLGYYINPLINVLLATIFLKERLNRLELFSFLLATSGVLYMTVHYSSIPWTALLLASSFGVYGLIKKVVPIGAWAGLTIETLIMTPFALLFLIYVQVTTPAGGAFLADGLATTLLLMGAGAATAIPLLLFATGARRISFSLIGFLQYIGPTIMLILGVFLFQEPFSQVQLISFSLIWISLLIFTTSRSRAAAKQKRERLQDGHLEVS